MKYRNLSAALSLLAILISVASIIVTMQLARDQQLFERNLTSDVIERQLLLEVKRAIIRNASKTNVIVLVDVTDEKVDKELFKELLTYHTENIYYYRSIENRLSEFAKDSLDRHLEKTQEMFVKLLGQSESEFEDFDEAKGELYEFSEMLIKEIDKLESQYL